MRTIALSVCLAVALASPLIGQAKPSVAVLPFHAVGVSEADALGLALLFEAALQATATFTIIEQTRTDAVLKAQEFSVADCTDEVCAVEIGRLLAAERIVLGTAGRIGQRYYLAVKLVDVATGVTLGAQNEQAASLEAIIDALGVLAGKVSGRKADASPPGDVATQSAEPATVPAPTGDRVPMVLVRGGSFTMGERAIAEPVHKATVSGFLMGRTEVTQGQYQVVLGENPAEFTGDAARPVERVSWLDAVTFCNKLSLLEGLRPCYTISRASVTCDFSKNGYRLPTEAEWEYAARGGLAGRGYAFAGSNTADDVAWYYGDSGNRSMPVATKLPNELGIYDMSGSLWEWCWDWYGPYPATEQVDARGPASGQRRVTRGGSWNDGDSTLRCAHRNSASPDMWDNTRVGFRVVRRVD